MDDNDYTVRLRMLDNNIVAARNRAAKPASLGHTVIFTEILANFYDIISPLKFQTNPAWP